jgi:DUF177 domain-containing protein
MLQINVHNELRQPIGSVNEYELDEPSLKADGDTVRSLHGLVRLLRTDRGLLARVDADGLIDAQCSRCLKDAQAPLHIDFEEEYVPVVDANTGAPVTIDDPEGEVFRIDKRFDLDLREGLRQYILMSEPAKPLCRAACAGLCPICGADLNAGPHECEQPADERWAALKGLGKELQEGRN